MLTCILDGYDDMMIGFCDEAWLDVWLGFVLWWMRWCHDMYARWMIGCLLDEC